MSREEMIRVFMSTPTAGLPVSLHERIIAAVRNGVCGDQIETAINEWIDDYQITASIYAEALKQIKEAQ